MKIVVDELPSFSDDCLFSNEASQWACLFTGRECEMNHNKYDSDYGKCPYLIEKEALEKEAH